MRDPYSNASDATGWFTTGALSVNFRERIIRLFARGTVSAVIYVIPQTSVLGAILLTAYLGGATVTHLRVGEPFFGPILFGVFIWLGIFLRFPRLRTLLPLRR